jgi:formylglycine-generating enzyme required for sulfatase activity
MSVSPGQRFGRYRVGRELGRGGEAIVHLAEDEVLKRPVALKIFPLTVAVEGSTGATRFRREVEALARLDHPGICRIHEAGIKDGFPYIAMSYVEGTTLDLTSPRGEAEAVAIVEDVARTVAAAHAAGIVHGDLKPQNVLVAGNGSCVVLDFGVSRFLDESQRAGSGRTAGTLGYLAPERFSRDPDAASDVYALGAVLFELVTGRTPFIAPTHAAFVKKVLLEDAPLCRSLAPKISRDLEAILARALHRQPERRYPTMAAFVDDLLRMRRGEPVSVARFGPVRRSARWVRRRPALAALAGFVLLFLATAVAIAVVKNRVLERYLERAGVEAGRSTAEAQAAQNHLVRYARLADGRRLSDLAARARRLVPPTPALLPELESWMASAQALARQLPEHRSALEALRARGVRNPEGRFAPGVSDAARREIEALTRRRARIAAAERNGGEAPSRPAAALVHDLDSHLRVLRSKSPRLEAWTHESSADAWHDATLSALIDDLGRFAGADQHEGTVRDVERRMSEARRLADEEGSTREIWHAAARAIADRRQSHLYDGLVLRQQVGLLPLGQNQETRLWEFLHVLSGVSPDPPCGRVVKPETGIVLVLLPGGVVHMGARRPSPGEPREGPNIDPHAAPQEAPIDHVRLDPFFISKFEMTEAQWVRVTGATHGADSLPGMWSAEKTTPVYAVDWYDGSRVLGTIGLALPTEAQWEYAARAGTTTPWWTGVHPDSLRQAEVFSMKDAHPVGRYQPNGFGLFDVAGNLAEWCADLFCRYESPRLAGTGERSALDALVQRVHRGGAFYSPAAHLRSACRSADPPAARLRTLGIRPARLFDR